jgi:hypothetical protein
MTALPYSEATGGLKAREEQQKVLRRFGGREHRMVRRRVCDDPWARSDSSG